MKACPLSRFAAGIAAASVLLAGCSGSQSQTVVPDKTAHRASGSNSPIQHVVLIVQENRTFNDFFATFAGADGTTTGRLERDPACGITQTQPIALKEIDIVLPQDLSHRYQSYVRAYDKGKMDGFDKIEVRRQQLRECMYPYQYTDPARSQPFWDDGARVHVGRAHVSRRTAAAVFWRIRI